MSAMRMRVVLCAAVAVGVLGVEGVATASADATMSGATAAKRVAITGVAQTGERFRGTYRIERLMRASDGSVYAGATSSAGTCVSREC